MIVFGLHFDLPRLCAERILLVSYGRACGVVGRHAQNACIVIKTSKSSTATARRVAR